MNDPVLSQAIVAYLGKGRSPFPREYDDAVRSMPDVDGEALLMRVRQIVSECMAIEIDWSTRTLPEGGREAQQIMAGRHPELEENALDALSWMFTYNWR